MTACIMLIFTLSGINAQTIYIPIDSAASNILNYSLVGGSLQSYGCEGLDPTYWMSGSGNSVTVVFANAQTNPSIRVWGMNDDDSAELFVNTVAYPLTANSASYNSKVICNTTNGSPGPDGVLFSSGLLVGANSNAEGNYSYQDVTLQTSSVNSIRIAGVSGAGWGLAGVTITQEAAGIQPYQNKDMNVNLFPNPTIDKVTITGIYDSDVVAELFNLLGERILRQDQDKNESMTIDLSQIPQGSYFLKIGTKYGAVTKKVWKQ
ncbi:MAG: T9SS type A sorting domain-containing protein [Flavobacteriales bacterium]|nr:T9SS type A sorting domain-containing protein [Flavobacteriales bacterium]